MPRLRQRHKTPDDLLRVGESAIGPSCTRQEQGYWLPRVLLAGRDRFSEVSGNCCQLLGDTYLRGFFYGPADHVRVVRIVGDRFGFDSKCLSPYFSNLNIRAPVKLCWPRVCNALSYPPKLLLGKIFVTGDGKVGIGVWDERCRSDRLIRGPDPLAEENKTSEPLVISHQGRFLLVRHAEKTRRIRSRMSCGTSPKNGSVPWVFLRPSSAA